MVNDHPEESTNTPSGFSEPSDEVQQRNRVTGFILLCVVLGLIALAMIARVYGS
jgi:hypothetical protein